MINIQKTLLEKIPSIFHHKSTYIASSIPETSHTSLHSVNLFAYKLGSVMGASFAITLFLFGCIFFILLACKTSHFLTRKIKLKHYFFIFLLTYLLSCFTTFFLFETGHSVDYIGHNIVAPIALILLPISFLLAILGIIKNLYDKYTTKNSS